MKNTALYIPVNRRGGTSLVRADKIKMVKDILPTKVEMQAHFVSQAAKLPLTGKAEPYVIEVEAEEFETILREVCKKVGAKPADTVVLDIVLDSKSNAVFQIKKGTTND